MSKEITLTAALTVYKPTVMSSQLQRLVSLLQFDMTGTVTSYGQISVGTSATAFPLGQVTQPHWAFFNNLDATNYLTIRNGAGGADLLQLYPGEPAFCPLAIAAVPYGVANTNPCGCEFFIVSK